MEDFERACERVIGGLPKNNSLMPLGAFTGDRGVFSLGRSRTELSPSGTLPFGVQHRSKSARAASGVQEPLRGPRPV